jgi:Dolichyl-phosphate-mannose-protein mannosyltransferase
MKNHGQRSHPIPLNAMRILMWSGLLFFISIVIIVLLDRINVTGSITATVGFTLSAVIGYGVISRWLNRPISRGIYAIVLIVIALGARVAWVLSVDTQPVSDFKVMYDSAIKAADGDFSFSKMDYYIRWVYQLGYTLYEGLIVRIFGASLVPLKLFNALFETLTVWIVYRMAASLFGETSGRIAGLMYATYIPNIIMSSVLTNQHLSTLLFAAGCCIAVTHRGRNGISGSMAVALCFALGSVFRPMGSFYVGLFLLFVVLFEWMKAGRWQQRVGTIVKKGASFIAVYVVVLQLISYSLIAAGITELKLTSNQEPYWKFMVGLNAESGGQWNDKDARYVVNYPLGHERNEVELAILKERLNDPVEVSALFLEKWSKMWAGTDDSVNWSLGAIENTYDWQLKLVAVERSQYAAYALFGWFSIIMLLFHQWKSTRSGGAGTLLSASRISVISFPILLLLAYSALHMIIEIQTRYRLDVLPFFIVIASFGCTSLAVSSRNWKLTRRKRTSHTESPSNTVSS